MSGRTIVVVSADARLTDTTLQLEHLVRLLGEAGLAPQVALVGDGERLRQLRALAPVVVADRWRSRGLGRLPDLVGRGDLAQGYKSRRTRRWAAEVAPHPWIVLDARAASFLRHAPRRPPLVVAGLVGSTDRAADLAPVDVEAIGSADLWLAGTRHQAEELHAAGHGPALVVGDLGSGRDLPALPPEGEGARPVVLSSPSPAWSEPAHTVEVVRMLRRRRPDVALTWLVDRGDDAWLARHDLARLGDDGAGVTVAVRGDRTVERPRLVIRTGYAATDGDLVLASALEGIPTVGFELGDLPEASEAPLRPFDVEGLVDRADALLAPGAAARAGEQLRLAVRAGRDARHRIGPLLDLLGA